MRGAPDSRPSTASAEPSSTTTTSASEVTPCERWAAASLLVPILPARAGRRAGEPSRPRTGAGWSALFDVRYPATPEGLAAALEARDELLVCGIDWSGTEGDAIQAQTPTDEVREAWRAIYRKAQAWLAEHTQEDEGGWDEGWWVDEEDEP